MNIHPLIVHFPIALLTTYAVFECLRLNFITRQTYWKYVKATLAILGTAGGYAALLTGDIAKELNNDPSLRQLIHTHEFFAKLSVLIFSVVAAGYAVAWIKELPVAAWLKKFGPLWALALWLQRLITETPLTILLAIAGLAALMITGALGATIVYGPDQDIFTSVIYRFFFQ